TPETAKSQAIALYQKGEYEKAISLFYTVVTNNQKDGEAFYYLGAAQLKKDDSKAAQKSFQKAAKLLPQDVRPVNGLIYVALQRGKLRDARKNASKAVALNPSNGEAHYLLGVTEYQSGNGSAAIKAADRAIALEKSFAPAYLLKAQAGISSLNEENWLSALTPAEQKKRFTTAIETLQNFPDISANSAQANQIRDTIEGYNAFAEYFERREKQKDTSPVPLADNPNETKLALLSKPRANYTEEARKSSISGTVRVLVLFGKNGKTFPVVMKGLPYGLTEQALRAASQIRFEPMKKDGQPVSIVRVVEYNFNLY
ncbi:MAG: tetratricopeptide repeat protein, partial [Pyrinomonadaceae bacterium]